MLAQALGGKALALRIMDDPESLKPVLHKVTALWLAVARQVLDILPPVEAGHFHRYGLWAPGTFAAMTVDAAALFSVATYRRVFMPYDRMIADSLDHLLIHSHSGATRHWVNWDDLPDAGIQVLEDPGALPSWPQRIATWRALQGHGHPLLLSLREDHLDAVRTELSPRGLALEGHMTE
jgi:hypothetical protein